MSTCTPCTRIIDLPLCLDSIDLGFMAINTPIFIYIQNNTTGRLIRLQSISTNGGLVQIDTTDIVFNKNQNYECWATLLSSTAIDNRISLTGNEQTYTCASLNFKQLFDKDNVTTTYY